MAISGIGSVFQPATESSADKTNSIFNQNADMYLKLFLTQLKNQDPTEPVDASKMTEQLGQLNTSQQLIATNKHLEDLVTVQQNSQAASLAGFINKNVEYLGDTFYKAEGASQKFSYFVDGEYADVNLEVRDEKNKLIIRVPANKTKGTHDFTWDGKDSLGNAVVEGTYKVSAVSKNSDDKFGALSTFLSGTVTGIDYTLGSANPTIFVGTDKNRVGVDISRISAIAGGPIATTTTTTNNI